MYKSFKISKLYFLRSAAAGYLHSQAHEAPDHSLVQSPVPPSLWDLASGFRGFAVWDFISGVSGFKGYRVVAGLGFGVWGLEFKASRYIVVLSFGVWVPSSGLRVGRSLSAGLDHQLCRRLRPGQHTAHV